MKTLKPDITTTMIAMKITMSITATIIITMTTKTAFRTMTAIQKIMETIDFLHPFTDRLMLNHTDLTMIIVLTLEKIFMEDPIVGGFTIAQVEEVFKLDQREVSTTGQEVSTIAPLVEIFIVDQMKESFTMHHQMKCTMYHLMKGITMTVIVVK